ncbi:ribosome silencing factor [Sinanaerobacter chloroacetimidivorans]|jgi:ribosome-associated protein|uniref:Ribosomal silencing factor RsfS n=1 Tax=Sinanaerobacter chloroacetimidivorans TaxID=2818044 RepID=A0A8J8B0I0_9FIRM|nr:ribosome silencing factor [Sinanaerobacter chloroacetimidivorans]MBR0596651.1 ribosome silencing factor [Sinanaerobacter chloroacetimidivorans]
MNNREVALKAAAVLDSKKALDIVVIDISEKSSFADYLVIASGGSERQVGTLSQEIEDQFAKEGIIVKNIEGKKNSGWILMDFGDVIVNIFSVEQRERYNIEKVWSDCSFITLEDHSLQ